ncbi:hypothetical protein M0R45_026773 [Rubus argutus]|uniref:Uncharacterized protein n=1 Tax=Rubus argutus TaxID=59490 RepID=A0AAW1X239_RUBAR
MVFIASLNHKTLNPKSKPQDNHPPTLRHQIEQNSLLPISQQRLLISQSLQLSTQNNSALFTDLGIGPLSTLTLHTPFFGDTQPHRYAFLIAKPPSQLRPRAGPQCHQVHQPVRHWPSPLQSTTNWGWGWGRSGRAEGGGGPSVQRESEI